MSTMTYILVIWTVVAAGATNTSYYRERDWRPIGTFKSQQFCVDAARIMNVNEKLFRCIPTGDKQ